MQLSEEQQKVFDTLVSSEQRVQTLGGYAGTGKTTIIRALAAQLPDYAVCAYTGKAAHVLQQKGCQASTIHSLIYFPLDNDAAIAEAEKQVAALIAGNAPQGEIDRALHALEEARKPRFELRDDLVDGDGNEVHGIIVDEASMVPESIYDDLLSFDVPLIFVGDHGQLPPVSEGGAPFNLMASPMHRLETIHRNAGPIAYFAEHIRKGGSPRSYGSNNVVQVLGRAAATAKLLCSASQVICPYNRSRVESNRKIRTSMDRFRLLETGDRVICLRNDRQNALFNGMQATVTRVDLDRFLMDFTDDAGQAHADVEFDPEQFGQEKYYHLRGGPHPFDYGYAVTCHKSQGSEWPHVLVLDQGWKWEYSRWAYTAASRASERLTWIAEK
jgi:exodeoxyribonuclease-5